MEEKCSCRAPLPVSNRAFHCLLSCLLVILLCCQGSAAYKNYTVGDSLGWFDNLLQPKVDYQRWTAGKSYSLGDFLIFNTDKNHSVVQTYNATTYEQCNYDDAEADDTTEWSAAAPEYSKDPVTVEVPLVKEGPTYFFSGDYDGEQCQHGQHFMINVTHGRGLPESLKSTPEAPAPTRSDDGGSTVPDTFFTSSFDNPKDTAGGDAKQSSHADGILAMLLRKQSGRLHGGLGFLWFLLLIG